LSGHGVKEFLHRTGRVGRKLVGERTYDRLFHLPAAQWALRRAGFFNLPTLPTWLSQSEIAQLHGREVQVALSLGVIWVYNSFIEGDIVEFGTATGVTAKAIANAMAAAEASRPPKKLHLFDSFAGLPAATSAIDRDSHEFRSGIWYPGLMKEMNADELLKSCAAVLGAGRVVIHPGWFADTVSRLSPEQKFAFIHFDGDMYQSTIDAIGGLLSRGAISKGAVICFDDWNCGRADPDFGERRAWSELTERYAVRCSDWRSYSTMGQSFFIHDYRSDLPAGRS